MPMDEPLTMDEALHASAVAHAQAIYDDPEARAAFEVGLMDGDLHPSVVGILEELLRSDDERLRQRDRRGNLPGDFTGFVS